MNKIKESELIITDEGKIYHLGLHPDELGDYIITVGDPNRVKKVSKHFDKIEVKNQKREFVTHTGYLGKKRISVIGTGIGPDNIDILINEIDALKNIDFNTRTLKTEFKKLHIIRMGTSGSIRKDIPVDSIVGSSHGLGLDGLMNFYNYERNEFQRNIESSLKDKIPALFDVCIPYLFESSEYLLNSICDEYKKGITLTAGGFYGPQGRELRVSQKTRSIIDEFVKFKFEDNVITNFEMETSAIYGLSKLLGHEALSVNAIIANRADKTFSKDPYGLIEIMIEKTIGKIDAL